MTDPASLDNLRKHIGEIAQSAEKLRQFYLGLLVAGIGVASFAVTFLILSLHPHGIDMRYLVVCGALLPSGIIYLLLGQMYRRAGTKKLIDGISRSTGLQYRDDGCFALDAMKKHKILPGHNKSKLETGFQGQHCGTPVALQEVVLTELQQDPDHKKKQKEYVRFWGLLVRIQMTRMAQGHTAVVPRVALNTFFKGDFSQFHVLSPAANGRFEKIYDVMGTDTVEAKMVINATFRDRFLAASKSLRAYWAEASIMDQDILFAFQRFRPLVEITPLWKPVSEQHLRYFAEELESIAALIDALKANPQLGFQAQ